MSGSLVFNVGAPMGIVRSSHNLQAWFEKTEICLVYYDPQAATFEDGVLRDNASQNPAQNFPW